MSIEELTPEQAYDLGQEDRKALVLNFTLSRRDHFAMAAMQGLLSRNNPVPDVKNDGDVPEFIAQASVMLADALIEELDGGTE